MIMPSKNGKILSLMLNDSTMDYTQMRENLSEKVCIDIIEDLKRRSGKRCAIFFGNCQTEILPRMFVRHLEFRKNFFILQMPAVHFFNDDLAETLYGGGAIFQLCDLFISQHVHENNKYSSLVATSKLKNYLRQDTKIVWIPNVYFDGYFPQLPLKNKSLSHKIFLWKDRFTDELMSSKKNPDIEKFLDQICHENFISSTEIQNRIDTSFRKLRDREWFCDIKISDYIAENFKDKQIFFVPNHPFPTVLFELTKRILKFLGFHSENFLQVHELLDEKDTRFSLYLWDFPIYPSVKKFFQFQECIEIYYPNRVATNFHGNFREYMREYISQVWQKNSR